MTWSGVGRAGEAQSVLLDSITYNKSFKNFFLHWYQTKVSDVKLIPLLSAAPGPNAAWLCPFVAIGVMMMTGSVNSTVTEPGDGSQTRGDYLFTFLANKSANSMIKYLGTSWFVSV